MNKIIYIVALAIAAFAMAGCENFLDSENLTKKDTSNYPQTPEDADQLLVGVYSMLGR